MKNIKDLKKPFVVLLAGLLIAISPQALIARANADVSRPLSGDKLAKEVRHRLVMLPYYGVFDNLAYNINGSKVTLYGQVVRPSTRSDAERSVARINGVTQVVNRIKVLPLSSFDDSIRGRTYRALARTGGLYRYLSGGNPSLHIVVDRGHITLAGVVGNEMDRRLAYITARSVPGAFSVTNDLRLDGEGVAM